MLGTPGPVNAPVPASLIFGQWHEDFAVTLRGANSPGAHRTTISLHGTGKVINSAQRLGTGGFHVDVATGYVTTSGATPAAAPREAGSPEAAIFTGNAVEFNSTLLVDYPGDTEERALNVSVTDASGQTIGQTLSGVTMGERVIIGPITATGPNSNFSSRATVRTLAGPAAVTPDFAVPNLAPSAVAVGPDGSVYVADKSTAGGVVRKFSASGSSSMVAAVPGVNAVAFNPVDGALIAAGTSGLVRVAPAGTASLIAKGARTGVAVNAQGVIYTEKGTSIESLTLSPGSNPALNKSYVASTLAKGPFALTAGLAVDASGALFVAASSKNIVQRIAPDGTVATIAGTGTAGIADAPGNSATFNSPSGIVAVNGSLAVCDAAGNSVRLLLLSAGADPAAAASWTIVTMAGTGSSGATNGAGNAATFSFPAALAASGAESLYVADFNNHAIRLITFPFTSLPAIGVSGSAGSTDPVVHSSNYRIRRVSPAGRVETVAGSGVGPSSNPNYPDFFNQDGTGDVAALSYLAGIMVDAGGTLYFCDNNAIRKVQRIISTRPR